MFVSFTLSHAGLHQVSVTFRGKHLPESPFTLEVVDRLAIVYRRDYSKVGDQPASRFGSQGAGDGQFNNPWSVACNLRGEIVVADSPTIAFRCLIKMASSGLSLGLRKLKMESFLPLV